MELFQCVNKIQIGYEESDKCKNDVRLKKKINKIRIFLHYSHKLHYSKLCTNINNKTKIPLTYMVHYNQLPRKRIRFF